MFGKWTKASTWTDHVCFLDSAPHTLGVSSLIWHDTVHVPSLPLRRLNWPPAQRLFPAHYTQTDISDEADSCWWPDNIVPHLGHSQEITLAPALSPPANTGDHGTGQSYTATNCRCSAQVNVYWFSLYTQKKGGWKYSLSWPWIQVVNLRKYKRTKYCKTVNSEH